jgi:hypothetical protein
MAMKKCLRQVLVFSFCACSSVQAAQILLSGSITGITGTNNDQIDQWRTNTVVKTLDPDADNVYGTAGFLLYATDAVGNSTAGSVTVNDPLTYDPADARATITQIPSYVTVANNGQTSTASSYGYKQIDDPRQPIGATVSDLESGAALRAVALGTEGSMLDITVGQNFPAQGLRIGILVGNADNYDGTIRLAQTAGNGTQSLSVQQTIPAAGQELGMYFFDITGAAVGDVFTLFLTKTNPQPSGGNLNANVLYGGITLDVIPEPSTALLLATGMAACVGWRRRRRA